jgi:hypothetical protein
MRVQCPQCQTTLQLPQAPPAGARIQCASCGAQFGVRVPAPQPVPVVATVQPQPSSRSAVRPVIVPPSPGNRSPGDTAMDSGSTFHPPAPRAIRPAASTSTAIPVAVTEIPEAVVEEPGEPAEPFKKKKKRKRFRRSSDGGPSFWTSPGAKLIIAGVFLVALLGAGYFFGVGKLGFLGRKSSLADFNNELVTSVNRFQMAAMPLQNQMNNPQEIIRGLAKLKDSLATTLDEVRSISPPSQGKAFYDAVLRFLERCDKFINSEIPQVEGLMRNGRAQEAGQLLMEGGMEIQRLENEYITAQKEFAKKHGFKIIEPPGMGRRRG